MVNTPATNNENTFSPDLLDTALHEIFLLDHVYEQDTPLLDDDEKAALQNFHNYLAVRVKDMFQPIFDEENSLIAEKLPADFFENMVFHYQDKDVPSACVFQNVPDGKVHICVSKGLLQLCRDKKTELINEDALLGVVGHEVSHIIHRYIKPYEKNDKAEEGGADIMSISYMKSAGRRPQHFLNIMQDLEKKFSQYNNKDDILEYVEVIKDVHPKLETRTSALSGIIETWSNEMVHFEDHVMDESIVAPLLKLNKVGQELPMDTAKMDAGDFDALSETLTTLTQLQKTVYATPRPYDELTDIRGNIWGYIIYQYQHNNPNKYNIQLYNYAGATKYAKLNPLYQRRFFKELNSVWNGNEWLAPVRNLGRFFGQSWDLMQQLYGENGLVEDAFGCHASLLNYMCQQNNGRMQNNLFNWDGRTIRGGSLAQKMDEFIVSDYPQEIKETREYISHLLSHPEEITPESFKDERLTKTLNRLAQMVRSGRLNIAFAHQILHPVVDITKDSLFPYADFIKKAVKANDNILITHKADKINHTQYHTLLGTLGMYDTAACQKDSTQWHSSYPNLLTDDFYCPENCQSRTDIELLGDNKAVCREIFGSVYVETTYDTQTHNVEKVKFDRLQLPYKKIGEYILSDEVNKIETEYSFDDVTEFYSGIHHSKTAALNTTLHIDIQKKLDELSTRAVTPDMADDVEKLMHYFGVAGQTRLHMGSVPFNYPGMNWYCALGSEKFHKKTAEDNGLDANSGRLFDFACKEKMRVQIIEAYLRMGREAVHNPEMAQKLAKDTQFFYAMAIHDERGMYESETHMSKVYKRYRKQLFELYNEKSLATLINPQIFFHRVGQNNLPENIYFMYQSGYSNLLKHLFPDFEPAQTVSDIQRLIDTYHNLDEHGNNIFLRKGYLFLACCEMKRFIENGRTDIPVSMTKYLNEVQHLSWFGTSHFWDKFWSVGQQDNLPETDINLLQNTLDNMQNAENWPTNVRDTITAFKDNRNIVNFDGHSGLSDLHPEMIVAIRNKICQAHSVDDKKARLGWIFQRYEFTGLTQASIEDILSLDSKPSVWDGSITDNVNLYMWLSNRHSFPFDGVYKRRVLTNLIEQLKTATPELQEELAIVLLSKNAGNTPAPLKEPLMDMWVNAVWKIMGEKPDDKSKEYRAKLQPYITKIKTKKSPKYVKNRLIPTKIDWETKWKLSYQLQDKLVSQAKLSEILSVEPKYKGSLSNEMLNKLWGIGIDELMTAIENEPAFAKSVVNFLLSPRSEESVERLIAESTKFAKAHISDNRMLVMDMYDNFWHKPFEVRMGFMKILFDSFEKNAVKEKSNALSSQKYQNNQSPTLTEEETAQIEKEARVDRVTDMLNRILPEDIPGRNAFYIALKNYAEAVKPDESYRTDFLLSGCLAAQMKTVGGNMDIGRMIKLFLESQGPAGIKVGQFLSSQGGIPKEIRSELSDFKDHATAPSRSDVFELIKKYHPKVYEEIETNGLGSLLGSASHYLTYLLNDNEVLSVSREKSGTRASEVYGRLKLAIEKTIRDEPENKHILYMVRDAIIQAESMNEIELNGNKGYKQMRMARRLYDNVTMWIDGYPIEFKTMPWTRQPEEYHVHVSDSKSDYSQSYRIMERAKGEDFKKLTNADIKRVSAKANFLLNLRTILKGDVFDDDRHDGQLKIETIPSNDENALHATKLRMNLFDTGSMSLEPPSSEDLQLLGGVLHRTLRGILVLSDIQEDNKDNKNEFILTDKRVQSWRKVFPKSNLDRLKQQLIDSDTTERLLYCFSAAIDETRNEIGEASLHLCKVERSLANLTHFSGDITEDEMYALMFTLLSGKGNVHKDIIKGMGADGFVLDNALLQTLLPKGKLDVSVVVNEYENPMDGLIDAIDDAIHDTKNLSEKEKQLYLKTLGNMLIMSKDIAPIDYLNDCLSGVKNNEVRSRLSKNLCLVGKMFIQAAHTEDKKDWNKLTNDMTTEIVSYLKENRLPEALVRGMTEKLSYSEAGLLRIAFIGDNKLTIGKASVQKRLHSGISSFVEQWQGLQPMINKFIYNKTAEGQLLPNVYMQVGKLPDEELIDRELKTKELKLNSANQVLNMLTIGYGNDK